MDNKIDVIVCDVDGCLVNHKPMLKYLPKNNTREEWDEFAKHYDLCIPNKKLGKVIKSLSQDYPIIFLTAREENSSVKNLTWNSSKFTYETSNDILEITNKQIAKAMGFFTLQFNCEKYLWKFRKYNDFRPSHEYKEAVLVKEILPKYNVIFAIDDELDNISIFQKYGIDTVHYTIR